MSIDNITEYELVRKFMGYELKQGKQLTNYIAGGNEWYVCSENFTTTEQEWQPDRNWNHLMSVVEELPGKNDYHFLDEQSEVIIKNIKEGLFFVEIDKVWIAVVAYIKWYNTQIQPS